MIKPLFAKAEIANQTRKLHIILNKGSSINDALSRIKDRKTEKKWIEVCTILYYLLITFRLKTVIAFMEEPGNQ